MTRQRLFSAFGMFLLAACVSCSPPPAALPPAATTPTTTPPPAAGDPPASDPAAGDPKSNASAEPPVDRSNQLLRHAVFFSFKETSSEEDIQKVAEAFAALPKKIDAIVDFQWGVNNSPEKLNDGFTHCFLLTFKDEAGRKTYLPHPEHKAFGDVLRPHMAKVFVIDYWGTPSKKPLEKELKHAVFFKFKDDASPEDVRAIEEAFAALPEKIEAIKAFEWGRNNSPEKHDHGFTHCFMVTFDSEEGRKAYLPHKAHEEFVKQLKPVLDKARVLDFWATK